MPLTPTAAADSLTGFAIAWQLSRLAGNEAPFDFIRLSMVCAISILAYWIGMVTNDLFDWQKDTVRAPDRPLVSGAVTARSAMGIIVCCLASAVTLAIVLNVLPGFLLLLVTIVAYNSGGKRIPLLGNLLMGSCRSLNLLLGSCSVTGAALSEVTGSQHLVTAACVLGLYIAGVTAISILEDRPYHRDTLVRSTATLIVYPLFLAYLGQTPGEWGNAAVFLWLLARELRLPREHAPDQPHPAGKVVRGGLRCLYLLDAGLLWYFDLPWAAAGVYGLFVLGWLWMRWWLKSGVTRGKADEEKVTRGEL